MKIYRNGVESPCNKRQSQRDAEGDKERFMNRNFQKELDMLLEGLGGKQQVPALLLHSCCAPCSSYVLEYLSQHFRITVFYYNPNIYPEEEYWKRVEEQKALIGKLPAAYPVTFLEGKYEQKRFYEITKGMELLKEGGDRCFQCFRLRLQETGLLAKERGYDYFTTTLSISPMKNAAKLNEIGESLADELGVSYLPSDFKKRNGYKRSTELSKAYGLYRQDYCGCIFSKRERSL